MYRKQIMWKDLDMNKSGKDGEDIYASPKVVEVNELMNNYLENLGYTPKELIFDIERVSKPGIYTKAFVNKPETADTLKDMIKGTIELEKLIETLYYLSEDKKLRQFRETNPAQKTLRHEL